MLFLHNDVIERLLEMKDCIEVQEQAFMAMEDGQAIHRPRIDMYTPSAPKDGYYRWRTMEGWYNGVFAIRMKSNTLQSSSFKPRLPRLRNVRIEADAIGVTVNRAM